MKLCSRGFRVSLNRFLMLICDSGVAFAQRRRKFLIFFSKLVSNFGFLKLWRSPNRFFTLILVIDVALLH